MDWRQENGTIYIEINEDDMTCLPVQLPPCCVGDALQMMLYDASTDVHYSVTAMQHFSR